MSLKFRGRLRGDLAPAGQEIDLQQQEYAKWRDTQHSIDGQHTDITAETIDVVGATKHGGPLTMPGASVITPPQITANQNDYRPRLLEQALWLRLQTDASRTITGLHRSLLSGLDEFRHLAIANVGNFDIVLAHNSSSSLARNRFGCPGSTDLTIQTSECVELWYDTHSANWRVVAGSGAASGGGVVGALADADYGDVTVSGGGTVMTIDNDVVTFAKMQNITSDRLLGRDTASSGNTEEIAVSGGIEFTGSTGIQTSAFTGDVTKSAGGTALTIANDAVTYAKMQDVSAADRLLGRGAGGGSGDVQEITAGTGLSFSGTTLNATGLGGTNTAMFTFAAGDSSGLNPGDALTFRFGNQSGFDPASGTDNLPVMMPFSGTVASVYGRVVVLGTLGTAGQHASFSIRNITAATTEAISATVPFSATNNDYSKTGMTLAFSAGDTLDIEFTTPTWTTNPTQCYFLATVLVQP